MSFFKRPLRWGAFQLSTLLLEVWVSTCVVTICACVTSKYDEFDNNLCSHIADLLLYNKFYSSLAQFKHITYIHHSLNKFGIQVTNYNWISQELYHKCRHFWSKNLSLYKYLCLFNVGECDLMIFIPTDRALSWFLKPGEYLTLEYCL